MSPASRRAGILAGLALAALLALGFVHQSRLEWTLRCRAEAELRMEREAEMEQLRAAHAEELRGMKDRVALLESDLAKEREQRAGSEAPAVQRADPALELEASKGELARAYARIAELERGAPEVGASVAALRDGTLGEAKVLRLRICEEIQAKDVVAAFEADASTALVDIPQEKLGKIVQVIRQIDLEPEGAMNQGVDYLAPPEAGTESGSLANSLNQGLGYVAPPDVVEGTEVQEPEDDAPATIKGW
ncbi:MAG: hypothetical protein K8T20_03255 [Planctomycetes bacterium]|nr:hypothetical protein [Planctomycetota bacterium]